MTEGKVSVSDSMQYYAITALSSEYENVNKSMLGNNKVAAGWPSLLPLLLNLLFPQPHTLVNLTNIIPQGKRIMCIIVRLQLTTVVAVSTSFTLQHCLMLKYVKNTGIFKYIFMHANNTPTYKR